MLSGPLFQKKTIRSRSCVEILLVGLGRKLSSSQNKWFVVSYCNQLYSVCLNTINLPYTVKPRLKATSVMRLLRYYGHFF